MPAIQSDGCPLHVEIDGPEGAPVLMLSNSLGVNLSMWEPQLAPFMRHFRLVRYDRRGHGRSGVTPGPYTMEQLARDDLAIMDGLGLAKVNFCGISMGGMVAQWLGAFAPERIDKLILSNTNCHYPLKDPWNDRIKTIREHGMGAIVDTVLGIWFTKNFHAREPETIKRFREMMVSTPPEGYIACASAVRDMDHRDIVARIKAPTLLIAGRHDASTTVEAAEFIRDRIPGAKFTILDAAHIANVEQASAFNAEVLGFLRAYAGRATPAALPGA
jgi:3-oxoadipate enol-lactonase